MGRFLKTGSSTSIPGQEGIPAVYSPMAHTLEDLDFFWKAVIGMQPWKYDPSVNLLPLVFYVNIKSYLSPTVSANSMAEG